MANRSFPQPPYPLHESVADHLDKQYVEFYNEHLINRPQVQYQSVAEARETGLPIGAGPAKTDLSTKDFHVQRQETSGPDIPVRVFTPDGETPEDGWPVAVYFHGGGWVLGGIGTENVVCSHVCSRARCVVVTVDYRLAPENPFPAAVDDSWEALRWTHDKGPSIISINPSKMIVGGSSAGGNLAAVMAQRSLVVDEWKILGQFLIVPVVDNTATTQNNDTYKAYEFTAALPAEKMMWYRKHYLPSEKDWSTAEASPLLWRDEDWSKLPPALIVMGELDVLRGEGEQFAAKLEAAGVTAVVKVMKGMPHPFLAMDGVLQAGKDAITYISEFAAETFDEQIAREEDIM